MQVLEAGDYKYLLLELDSEFVANIARQAGFEFKIDDGKRTLSLDLLATDRQAPLLLFDAADPGNLGWFSRCQFYVDGRNGAVLQTPLSVANQRTAPDRPFLTQSSCRLPKNCRAASKCLDASLSTSKSSTPFCSIF